MRFGDRLRAARVAAGLTQNQLAEKSGVPVGTIRDYEQGKRDPLLSTAQKLALALGFSLDVLNGTEELPEQPAAKPGRPRKAEEPAAEEPKKRTRKKKGE